MTDRSTVDDGEILDALRCAVMVVAVTGEILEARGATARMLDRPHDEIVGTSLLDHLAGADADLMAQALDAASAAGTRHHPLPLVMALVRPDGTTVPSDVLVTGLGDRWVFTFTSRVLSPYALDIVEQVLDGDPIDDVAASVVRRFAELFDVKDGRHSCHALADVGTPAATAHSAGDTSRGLEEALLAEATSAGSKLLTEPGQGLTTMGVDELPERLRAEAAALGYRVMVVGAEGDPASAVWTLIWFHTDPDVVRLSRSVDAARRSLLRIIRASLDRSRFEAALAEAARTDPLTGLANRSAFDDAFTPSGPHRRAAVIYLDLDEFKSVNDTYGHPVGDAVLVEVARRIERSCRPTDLVARLGGDEFAVLIRGVDAGRVRDVADRITAEIRRPLRLPVGPPRIEATAGIADTDDVAFENLVHRADEMLVELKRSRRTSRHGNTPTANARSNR